MKEKYRELLYKHTYKVDNWNDAIFTNEFDDLVDELDDLFSISIVSEVSRSAKVKINRPFEIEETNERYEARITNYINDNGIEDKKIVFVKIDF